MRQIAEQQIQAMAPNPAAASNGKKISQKGDFVRLERAEDDSFYLGECRGSGKSNYITTADFMDPANPVFRCTCPSRQFPCKHSLALLYELMAGKTFAVCPIPQEILDKRGKKQARAEKAAADPENAAEKAPPKVNKAARAKKLQKQMEGLDLTGKLVADLLNTGLGAMGGTALNTYRQLSKQLGDYYLPGPQRLLNRLILEIAAFQQDGADSHYETAVAVLERLNALTKKARLYLSAKLESGEVGQDDNLLFEELGGAWKLSELAALGLCKENVRLAQLSFWVTFDEARGEYIDTGAWADVETGEVSLTQNYRPVKALKYVKQDDTVFGTAAVPLACFYPGEGTRRVRWEGMELSELTPEDLERLRAAGSQLAPAVKEAKNLLKNTLADPLYLKLIRFSNIALSPDGPVLTDNAGSTILLGDSPELEPTTLRLSMLPDPSLVENQVLIGGFWYDSAARRLKLQPLSILAPDSLIRLLY